MEEGSIDHSVVRRSGMPRFVSPKASGRPPSDCELCRRLDEVAKPTTSTGVFSSEEERFTKFEVLLLAFCRLPKEIGGSTLGRDTFSEGNEAGCTIRGFTSSVSADPSVTIASGDKIRTSGDLALSLDRRSLELVECSSTTSGDPVATVPPLSLSVLSAPLPRDIAMTAPLP